MPPQSTTNLAVESFGEAQYTPPTMVASLQVVRKFEALKNRVDEALDQRLGNRPRYHYDPIDAAPWFERWIKIREGLVTAEPSEFGDIPACVLPTPEKKEEYDGRGAISRIAIERLRSDMRDAWDVLHHPSRQVPQVSIDRQGIFVAGQPFDAMLAITSILRAATKSITVVDGYVSEHTLSLLGVKADPVTAKILMRRDQANPALVTAVRAFIAQYAAGPPLEIRTTTAFHDRFIVIDDSDYYHFGASLKDAAKRSAFMFSKIEEPSVIATLSATISREWSAATPVVI